LIPKGDRLVIELYSTGCKGAKNEINLPKFKEESFQQDELDNLDSIKTDLEANKTPSQRLRGILYINYQQDDEGYKDFMTYYIGKMDKLCEHFKSKLDK
jgi:DNA-binding ferritin-like protein